MPPTTKRPTAKNGAAREIELSNATCALALGGSRKAWMGGNGWPSNNNLKNNTQRPRAGPTQRPVARQVQWSPYDSSSVVLPSLEQNRYETSRLGAETMVKNLVTSTLASSTASEVLPTAPSEHRSSLDLQNAPSGPKSPQFENVLPSPAPSEEHRQGTVCIINLEDETVSDSRAMSVADGASRVRLSLQRGSESADIADQQQQSHRLHSDEISSAEPNPDALKTLTEEHGGLERMGQRLRESYANKETDIADQIQPFTAPQQVAGIGPWETASQRGSVATDGQELSMATPSEGFNRPTNQVTPPASSAEIPPSAPLNLGGIKRHFGRLIAQRLQRIHGDPGSMVVQIPRLTLLQEALRKDDLFYLVLHQMYCLNSLSPMVQSASQFGFKAVHSHGLIILSQLLCDNNSMTFEAIEWFSKMPLEFELTLRTSSVFRFTYEQILAFLANMSQHWTLVKQQSSQRKCPPSANEMAVVLGLHSLVLQDVIFRAILREILPGAQDRCFQLCEKSFNQYQDHSIRVARSSTQLMSTENQAFIDRVKELWVQHQEHVSRNLQQMPAQAPNAAQMAPPQQRQSNPHHPFVTNSATPRPSGRDRALQINTSTLQQVSSSQPGAYTPIVPSSPSIQSGVYTSVVPSSPSSNYSPNLAEWSRMLSWASSGAQRTTNPLVSTPPSGQQSPPPFTTPARTAPLPSTHSLPTDQQALFPTSAPSGYWSHTRNQAQSSTNNPRADCRPQAALPSQAVINIQVPGNRGGFVLPLQGQSASQPVGSQSNPQTGNPYLLPFSAFADVHKPFVRPTSLNAQTTTSFSALHQAHVRSPTLSVIDTDPPSDDQKYFVYLEKILISPGGLRAGKRHLKWSWATSREDAQKLALSSQDPTGYKPRLNIQLGSQLCRIRCIKANTLKPNFTESDWVAAENSWPSGIAAILNDRALEVRRKLHHGKDQPIDITSLIKEGENSLSIAVSKIHDEAVYAFAVETSQVTNARRIKERITRLDWAEARDRILQRSINADPDVQILDPKVVLELTDPYTSSMWYIPVRGRSCHHNHCFDLDVFLSTRGGKAKEPCGPDAFRCPICGTDARPQSLVVDGFLMRVREELQRLNRLDAKAIVLDEAGNWQIKELEVTGEPGDGSGGGNSEQHAAITGPPSRRKASEIIDLDSDD